MAITFPRPLSEFIETLKIQSIEWDIRRNDQFSGLGNGQILSANVAPPLWNGSVRLALMSYDEYTKIRARIATLDGSMNSFHVYGPPRLYPQSDPDGSILGASVVTIDTLGSDNKSLRLTGLPAGYQLTEGDLFSYTFSSGTYQAMHMICEDAIANGSGLTPFFEIRPHLFPDVTVGTGVTLIKPTAKAIIVPNSLRLGSISGQSVNGAAFDVIQRLK